MFFGDRLPPEVEPVRLVEHARIPVGRRDRGDGQVGAGPVRGAAEDQRVQHDDVGHREEGREAAADLPADVGATRTDREVAVKTAGRAVGRRCPLRGRCLGHGGLPTEIIDVTWA